MNPTETRITLRRGTTLILSAFAFALALGPSLARADEPAAAPSAECPRGGPGMHGPVGLVHAALNEPIGLSSQQRAVLEASVASLRPPVGDDAAQASHRAALAAQIRAGAVDETALQLQGPTSEERAAHEAAAVAAISTLHDTLTADQRSALVAAVLVKHSGGPPPEAQGHRDGGPMRLFEGLGLTDAQESAVRAVLESGRPDETTMRTRFDAMRAEHEAKLRSFVESSFDAHAFLVHPANAQGSPPEGGADRVVHDLATVVPLLTAAQRESLAQRIEAGPPHRGPSET